MPYTIFDFDGQRTYFRVVLSTHPEYKAILALQDISKLKAIGDASGAVERLKTTFAATPGSLSLATELVREYLAKDDLPAAIAVMVRLGSRHEAAGSPGRRGSPRLRRSNEARTHGNKVQGMAR